MTFLRITGLVILLIGFLIIVLDTYCFFVGYQHATWIWHIQHLPEGTMIARDDAIQSMRDLSLKLKNAHRSVMIPALLMLIGGLIAGLARSKKIKSEQAGAVNPHAFGTFVTDPADAGSAPKAGGDT